MKQILNRLNPFKRILYIEYEALDTPDEEQYMKISQALSDGGILYRSCFSFEKRFAAPARYQIFIRKEDMEQAQRTLPE